MEEFLDRKDAGNKLAVKLERFRKDNPLILALPRGGVVTGYFVAKVLNAPLDTIISRKITLNEDPEFAVGAIAPGGVVVLNDEAVTFYKISEEDIKNSINKETVEMRRRAQKYKSGEYIKDHFRDTIIVVDDGLATGITAKAAIESVVKSYDFKKIIFAAPVCAKESVQKIKDLVDEIVCVYEPENLQAIGLWYKDFSQVTDEEVITFLEKANA